MNGVNGDVVIACADLAGRAGARDFEIGYLRDDVPVEDAGWYAVATYQGARIMTDEHRSPSAAALALAERLLAGGTCKCGRPVTLEDGAEGCRWRLVGKRWEPGCSAPALHPAGERGDVEAIGRAAAARQAPYGGVLRKVQPGDLPALPMNRAARRAAGRRRPRG